MKKRMSAKMTDFNLFNSEVNDEVYNKLPIKLNAIIKQSVGPTGRTSNHFLKQISC